MPGVSTRVDLPLNTTVLQQFEDRVLSSFSRH